MAYHVRLRRVLATAFVWQSVAVAALFGKPERIFNGKTLAGWEVDRRYWRVENEALVGEIPQGKRLEANTWAIWRGGTVADFDLRLEVRISGSPRANSGIQFRSQATDTRHVSGYQADLDTGAVWLGRLYDEHGRGLLAERGTRVRIAPDGKRFVSTFAYPQHFTVLFRPGEWNTYRIVAVGPRIALLVNGTLFCELIDLDKRHRDLRGHLALQLHAGPAMRVEFRNIVLEHLPPDSDRLATLPQTATVWPTPTEASERRKQDGDLPQLPGSQERLNTDFETGDLRHWKATGEAFQGQPVRRDGIAKRWAGQTSGKHGEYFIGGYEIVRDGKTGTLESLPFLVTKPSASFLIGGGRSCATRVEILLHETRKGKPEPRVIFQASGRNREQMHRVFVDLRPWQGKTISIRLVDESTGSWGHINFDDFRFHDRIIETHANPHLDRLASSPILHHLRQNPAVKPVSGRQAEQPSGSAGKSDQTRNSRNQATETLARMFVPDGFSVRLVAAEPLVRQPIAFTFDAKGRIWVAEALAYPQKQPSGKGRDRILILADQDHDGTFESRHVFASGLNLVSGLAVGYGGVWVGAAPELLFIPDRNGDDVPDGPPQVLLNGFGYADTHETLNNFIWGPDGWLYGLQGVFNQSFVGKPGTPREERIPLAAGVWRYHPLRHIFEVFAHGGSNQWGLDYDGRGEFFMTHCRSAHGGGLTTHVIQGGHYWNQVNRNYAPFISARPLPGRPWMKNYLLASARYGHGEGGAGRPGSRAVYGGHAHVGTLVYQGDNWPKQYRGHLLTHNLHGHQINHQVLVPRGSTFRVWHAGYDVFFCSDPRYVGVDLQCGPDGAVYFSDWYDTRHCHSPHTEQWDRRNGRLYRMQYDATYRPVRVDYTCATDDQLVETLGHPNAWHARMAQLVLSERAACGKLAPSVRDALTAIVLGSEDRERRLRALWTLATTDLLTWDLASRITGDPDPHLRAWAVRLAVEHVPSQVPAALLETLARNEPSPLVLRRLASAIPRLPTSHAWKVAEALARREEPGHDLPLLKLLWSGMAPLLEQDVARAMRVAEATPLVPLRDWIHWYAAKISQDARETLVQRLRRASAAERARLVMLLDSATEGMIGLPRPSAWSQVATDLYGAPETAAFAERLGARFNDPVLFERLRKRLQDPHLDTRSRRRAVEMLAGDPAPETRRLLIRCLDDPALALDAVRALRRKPHVEVADALLARLPKWNHRVQEAALEALSSRASWAERLLEAIEAGRFPRDQLPAFYARRIAGHDVADLTRRLERVWGRLRATSEERKAAIDRLVKAYRDAPLWAYSAAAGKQHFQKLCAKCHQPANPDDRLAPRLGELGPKGIRYVVENILDPNAVIGKDFQARLVLTHDGRVLSGLVVRETPTAITLASENTVETIPRDTIEQMKVSDKSFMPEGLLDSLNQRERIELLKYLMHARLD